MYKILLVEDSEESKNIVVQSLGPTFEIIWSSNLENASKSVHEHEFHLILLDVGLPDGDGFRFFSMLLNDNHHKKIPVIFLTANDGVSDKVLGISLGADDYIVKPFDPSEFKARIEMRLKKYHSKQNDEQVFHRGDLEINLSSQRAFLLIDQKRMDIQLTPLEFKILSILSTHEDQVFSRNQLLDKIWGSETHLTDRCVDTHICSLRKKMGALAGFIKAVYGEGYRFSSELNSKKVRARRPC